mmetsp:Transcript_17647/g.27745  ORF Transcript_17647/g.27745 Transcript_17647/m.27745 type:complete len:443 (-) Transcript_17647:103-1431(-)
MPRDPPFVYLYPLSNYQQGSKAPLLEKDSSVKERMIRMAELYKQFGMRRVVEGLLLAHDHCHPHVLLLQIGNTYFKLPGGRLRVGEHETDGLRRKLNNKLGTPVAESSVNWQIGELISTWWRPNFETIQYPYIPPHVGKPKECRKIFLTQLPPTGTLGVPKNLKLLAVPLFELYDNAHRYGPVIASLPQLLARIKFVYCDQNAQPLRNPHIVAYQLTNIDVHRNLEERKQGKDTKIENGDTKLQPTPLQPPFGNHINNMNNDNHLNHNGMDMNQHQIAAASTRMEVDQAASTMAISQLSSAPMSIPPSNPNMLMQMAQQQQQHQQQHPNSGNPAAAHSVGGVNPLLGYRPTPGLFGNVYNAQNMFQRQLQLQQLYAAQAQAQAQAGILRMPQHTLRAPNARIILTPTTPQHNPLTMQPMTNVNPGTTQPPPLPPPHGNNTHE